MKPLLVRSLPWVMVFVALTAMTGAAIFGSANSPYLPAAERVGPVEIAWAFSFMSFPLVGAVIAAKRPRNWIGWILSSTGTALALGLFAAEYVRYELMVPGADLPLVEAVAWFENWPFGLAFGSLIFVLLLFPTGRLPSPRWRPVGYFYGLWLGSVVVTNAFGPGEELPNPLSIDAAAPLFEAVSAVAEQLFPLLLLLGASAPLVRFVQARQEERAQIRWFAFSAVTFVVLVAVEALLEMAQLDSKLFSSAIFVVGLCGMAASIGVGVLKYRLYEIDRVINRALVYAALTAILAGVYLAIVFVLQGAVAGVGTESDLVVAASTLAVAALFSPLRRRVQAFIDHYFYRGKYDAAKTLTEFTARLRQEVDLDQLTAELVGVVRHTMQPAHISVWLRESADVVEA